MRTPLCGEHPSAETLETRSKSSGCRWARDDYFTGWVLWSSREIIVGRILRRDALGGLGWPRSISVALER